MNSGKRGPQSIRNRSTSTRPSKISHQFKKTAKLTSNNKSNIQPQLTHQLFTSLSVSPLAPTITPLSTPNPSATPFPTTPLLSTISHIPSLPLPSPLSNLFADTHNDSVHIIHFKSKPLKQSIHNLSSDTLTLHANTITDLNHAIPLRFDSTTNHSLESKIGTNLHFELNEPLYHFTFPKSTSINPHSHHFKRILRTLRRRLRKLIFHFPVKNPHTTIKTTFTSHFKQIILHSTNHNISKAIRRKLFSRFVKRSSPSFSLSERKSNLLTTSRISFSSKTQNDAPYPTGEQVHPNLSITSTSIESSVTTPPSHRAPIKNSKYYKFAPTDSFQTTNDKDKISPSTSKTSSQTSPTTHKVIHSVFAQQPKGTPIRHSALTHAIPTKPHVPTLQQTFKTQLRKTDVVQKPFTHTSSTIEKIIGLPLIQPTYDPSNNNSDMNGNHYDFSERLLGLNLINSKRHTIHKSMLHNVMNQPLNSIKKISSIGELSQLLDSYSSYTSGDVENLQTADMYSQFLTQQSIIACGNDIELGVQDFIQNSVKNKSSQTISSTVHSTLFSLHKLTTLPSEARSLISSASICALIDLFEEITDLDALADEIQTRCFIATNGTDDDKRALSEIKSLTSSTNYEFFLWLLSNREIKHLTQTYLSGNVLHFSPRIANPNCTKTQLANVDAENLEIYNPSKPNQPSQSSQSNSSCQLSKPNKQNYTTSGCKTIGLQKTADSKKTADSQEFVDNLSPNYSPYQQPPNSHHNNKNRLSNPISPPFALISHPQEPSRFFRTNIKFQLNSVRGISPTLEPTDHITTFYLKNQLQSSAKSNAHAQKFVQSLFTPQAKGGKYKEIQSQQLPTEQQSDNVIKLVANKLIPQSHSPKHRNTYSAQFESSQITTSDIVHELHVRTLDSISTSLHHNELSDAIPISPEWLSSYNFNSSNKYIDQLRDATFHHNPNSKFEQAKFTNLSVFNHKRAINTRVDLTHQDIIICLDQLLRTIGLTSSHDDNEEDSYQPVSSFPSTYFLPKKSKSSATSTITALYLQQQLETESQHGESSFDNIALNLPLLTSMCSVLLQHSVLAEPDSGSVTIDNDNKDVELLLKIYRLASTLGFGSDIDFNWLISSPPKQSSLEIEQLNDPNYYHPGTIINSFTPHLNLISEDAKSMNKVSDFSSQQHLQQPNPTDSSPFLPRLPLQTESLFLTTMDQLDSLGDKAKNLTLIDGSALFNVPIDLDTKSRFRRSADADGNKILVAASPIEYRDTRRTQAQSLYHEDLRISTHNPDFDILNLSSHPISSAIAIFSTIRDISKQFGIVPFPGTLTRTYDFPKSESSYRSSQNFSHAARFAKAYHFSPNIEFTTISPLTQFYAKFRARQEHVTKSLTLVPSHFSFLDSSSPTFSRSPTLSNQNENSIPVSHNKVQEKIDPNPNHNPNHSIQKFLTPTNLFSASFHELQQMFVNQTNIVEPSHYIRQLQLDQRHQFRDPATTQQLRISISRLKHKYATQQLHLENEFYFKLTGNMTLPVSDRAKVYSLAASPPPFSPLHLRQNKFISNPGEIDFSTIDSESIDSESIDSELDYSDDSNFQSSEEYDESQDEHQPALAGVDTMMNPEFIFHDKLLFNHESFCEQNKLDGIHESLNSHAKNIALTSTVEDLINFANDPTVPIYSKAVTLNTLVSTCVFSLHQDQDPGNRQYDTLQPLESANPPSYHLNRIRQQTDNVSKIIDSQNQHINNNSEALDSICDELYFSIAKQRINHQRELVQLESLFHEPRTQAVSNSTIGNQVIQQSESNHFGLVSSLMSFDPYLAVLPLSNPDNLLLTSIISNKQDPLRAKIKYAPYLDASDQQIANPLIGQSLDSLAHRQNGITFFNPTDFLGRPLISSPHISPLLYPHDKKTPLSSASILHNFIKSDLKFATQTELILKKIEPHYSTIVPKLPPPSLDQYIQDELREKIVFLPYPKSTSSLLISRLSMAESLSQKSPSEFSPIYRTPHSLSNDPTCSLVSDPTSSHQMDDYYRFMIPHLTALQTRTPFQRDILRDACTHFSRQFDTSTSLAVYKDVAARKIRTICDFGGIPVFLHAPTYDEPFVANPFAENHDLHIDGIPARENILPKHSLNRLVKFASIISQANSPTSLSNNPLNPDSLNPQLLASPRPLQDFTQEILPKSLYQNLLAAQSAALFEEFFFNHDKRQQWASQLKNDNLSHILHTPFSLTDKSIELTANEKNASDAASSQRSKDLVAMDKIQEITNFVSKIPLHSLSSLDPLLLRQIYMALTFLPQNMSIHLVDDLGEKFCQALHFSKDSHRAMAQYAQDRYLKSTEQSLEKDHFDMRLDQDKVILNYLQAIKKHRSETPDPASTDPISYISHSLTSNIDVSEDTKENIWSMGTLSRNLFQRRRLSSLSASHSQYLKSFHFAPEYVFDEIAVSRQSAVLELDSASIAALPHSFDFDLPPAGAVQWDQLQSSALLDLNYQLLHHYIHNPTPLSDNETSQNKQNKPWFFTWSSKGRALTLNNATEINPDLKFVNNTIQSRTERYYPLRPNATPITTMNFHSPFYPLRDNQLPDDTDHLRVQTRDVTSFSADTQQYVAAIFQDIASILSNDTYQPLYSPLHIAAPATPTDRPRLASSWSNVLFTPNETSHRGIRALEAPQALMEWYQTSSSIDQLAIHYNGRDLLGGSHSFPWAYSPFSPSGPSENQLIKMKPIYTLNHSIATSSQQVELWKDQLREIQNNVIKPTALPLVHTMFTQDSHHLNDPTLDFLATNRPLRPALLRPSRHSHLYLSLSYLKRIKARQSQLLNNTMTQSPTGTARSPHPRLFHRSYHKTNVQIQTSERQNTPSWWTPRTIKKFKLNVRKKILQFGALEQHHAILRSQRAASALQADPADWQIRFDATSSPTAGMFFNEDEIFSNSHANAVVDQLAISNRILRSPNLNIVNLTQNLITFVQHISTYNISRRRFPVESFEHSSTLIPPHLNASNQPSQLYLGSYLQSLPHFLKLQLPVLLPALLGHDSKVTNAVSTNFQSQFARIWTGRVNPSYAWSDFLREGSQIPIGSPLLEEKRIEQPDLYRYLDTPSAAQLSSFLTFKSADHINSSLSSNAQTHRIPITSLAPAIQQHLSLLYNDIGFNYDHTKPDHTLPYFHLPNLTNPEGASSATSPFSADVIKHKRETISLGELQAYSVRPTSLFDNVTQFHELNRAALPSLITEIMNSDLTKALQSPVLHQRSVVSAVHAFQSKSNPSNESTPIIPFSPLFTQIAHLAQSLLDITVLSHEFFQPTSDSAPPTHFHAREPQLSRSTQKALHGGTITAYTNSHRHFPRHHFISRLRLKKRKRAALVRLETQYKHSIFNSIDSFTLLHFGGDEDRGGSLVRIDHSRVRKKQTLEQLEPEQAAIEKEFVASIDEPERLEQIEREHYEAQSFGSHMDRSLNPNLYIEPTDRSQPHDLQVVEDNFRVAQHLNSHRITYIQNHLQPPIVHRLSPAAVSTAQSAALIAGLLNLPEQRAKFLDLHATFISPSVTNLLQLSNSQLGYRPQVIAPHTLRDESTFASGLLQRLHLLQHTLHFSQATTKAAFFRFIATDLPSNRIFSELNNLEAAITPSFYHTTVSNGSPIDIYSKQQELYSKQNKFLNPTYLETTTSHEIDRNHMTSASLSLAKVLTQDVSVRLNGNHLINPLFPAHAPSNFLNTVSHSKYTSSLFTPLFVSSFYQKLEHTARQQSRTSILWHAQDVASFHSISEPDPLPDFTNLKQQPPLPLPLPSPSPSPPPDAIPLPSKSIYFNPQSHKKQRQKQKQNTTVSLHPFTDDRPVFQTRAERLRKYISSKDPTTREYRDETIQSLHEQNFGKVLLYSAYVEFMPKAIKQTLLSAIDQIIPRVSSYRNYYVLPAIHQFAIDIRTYPGSDHKSRITHLEQEVELEEQRRLFQQQQADISEQHFASKPRHYHSSEVDEEQQHSYNASNDNLAVESNSYGLDSNLFESIASLDTFENEFNTIEDINDTNSVERPALTKILLDYLTRHSYRLPLSRSRHVVFSYSPYDYHAVSVNSTSLSSPANQAFNPATFNYLLTTQIRMFAQIHRLQSHHAQRSAKRYLNSFRHSNFDLAGTISRTNRAICHLPDDLGSPLPVRAGGYPSQLIRFARNNHHLQFDQDLGTLSRFDLFSFKMSESLPFPPPPPPSIVSQNSVNTDPWAIHEAQAKAAEERLVDRFAFGTTRLRNLVATLLDDVQHTDYLLRSELKHGILALPHIRGLVEQLTHGTVTDDDPDRIEYIPKAIARSAIFKPKTSIQLPTDQDDLKKNRRSQTDVVINNASNTISIELGSTELVPFNLSHAELDTQFSTSLISKYDSDMTLPINPPRDLALKRLYAYIGLDQVLSYSPTGARLSTPDSLVKLRPSLLYEKDSNSDAFSVTRANDDIIASSMNENTDYNNTPHSNGLHFRNRGLVSNEIFKQHNILSGFEQTPNYRSNIDFLHAKIDVVAGKHLIPTILIRASDAIFSEIATALRSINIVEKISDQVDPLRSHAPVTFSPRLLSFYQTFTPQSKLKSPSSSLSSSLSTYQTKNESTDLRVRQSSPSTVYAAEKGYLSKHYGSAVLEGATELHTLPFLYNREYLSNLLTLCSSNYLHFELLQFANIVITSPNIPAQHSLNVPPGVNEEVGKSIDSYGFSSSKYSVDPLNRADDTSWHKIEMKRAFQYDSPFRENLSTSQAPFVNQSKDIRRMAIQSVMAMFCFQRQEPLEALKFWSRIQFQKKRPVIDGLVQDWTSFTQHLEENHLPGSPEHEQALNPSLVTIFSKTIDDLCRLPHDYVAPTYKNNTISSPSKDSISGIPNEDLGSLFNRVLEDTPQSFNSIISTQVGEHSDSPSDKYTPEETQLTESFLDVKKQPNHHLLKYDAIYPIGRDHAFSTFQLIPLVLSLLAHPSHFESYFTSTTFNIPSEDKNHVKNYLLYYRHLIDPIDTQYTEQVQATGLHPKAREQSQIRSLLTFAESYRPNGSKKFVRVFEKQLQQHISIVDQSSSSVPNQDKDQDISIQKPFSFTFTSQQTHLRNKLMSLYTVSAIPDLLKDLRLNEEFPDYVDYINKDVISAVNLSLNSHGFPTYSQFMVQFRQNVMEPLNTPDQSSYSKLLQTKFPPSDSMFPVDSTKASTAPSDTNPFDHLKKEALGLQFDHYHQNWPTFLSSLHKDFIEPNLYNQNGPFAQDARYHAAGPVHSEHAYHHLNFANFNMDLIAQIALHYTFASPVPTDFSFAEHHPKIATSLTKFPPSRELPLSKPDRIRGWLSSYQETDQFHNSNSPFSPHSIPNKMVKNYQLKDFNSTRAIDTHIYSPQAATDINSPYHHQAKLIHEPTQYSPIPINSSPKQQPGDWNAQLIINNQLPYCSTDHQWVENILSTITLQQSWVHNSLDFAFKPLPSRDTYIM